MVQLAVQLAVQLRHHARLVHNLNTSSGFRLCPPSILIKKQSAAGRATLGALSSRMLLEDIYHVKNSQSQMAVRVFTRGNKYEKILCQLLLKAS